MKALELLTLLGFEELGPNPDDRTQADWIRQKPTRDISITLPPQLSDANVIDAIYDAGRRDQQTHIKRRHDAFARSLKYLEPTILLPSES